MQTMASDAKDDWILTESDQNVDFCNICSLLSAQNFKKAISSKRVKLHIRKPCMIKNNISSYQRTILRFEEIGNQIPKIFSKFEVDNSKLTSWKPNLNYKPNSFEVLSQKKLKECNPYIFELDLFRPLENELVQASSVLCTPVLELHRKYLENLSDLKSMLTDLRNYTELAIALEYCTERSYQGFIWLLQISTKDTNFVINALALQTDVHILNEIFTDPKVVKIIYRGDFDILYLQKDLSLYLVNMFDIEKAQKQIPITEQIFLKNIEKHTHYFFYLKNYLMIILINLGNKKHKLRKVYDECTEMCKRIYIKPDCNDDEFLQMFKNIQMNLSSKQWYALQELFKWRDEIARIQDEKPNYIFSNDVIIALAKLLSSRREYIIKICVKPLSNQRLAKITEIMNKAKDHETMTKAVKKPENDNKNEASVKNSHRRLQHCPKTNTKCVLMSTIEDNMILPQISSLDNIKNFKAPDNL